MFFFTRIHRFFHLISMKLCSHNNELRSVIQRKGIIKLLSVLYLLQGVCQCDQGGSLLPPHHRQGHPRAGWQVSLPSLLPFTSLSSLSTFPPTTSPSTGPHLPCPPAGVLRSRGKSASPAGPGLSARRPESTSFWWSSLASTP